MRMLIPCCLALTLLIGCQEPKKPSPQPTMRPYVPSAPAVIREPPKGRQEKLKRMQDEIREMRDKTQSVINESEK